MAGNQKGNIILTARGDLINLLKQRALGYGEMFIATKGYTTTAMAAQNPIYDISGGKKVQIKRIDAGDLFAGTNTKDEVYCLGGGSSLKWGGISFATSWDLAKGEAKENPNRIYMYVGTTTLNADAQTKQNAGAVETSEITEKYVASDSKEYMEPINPGDIFFYNPQLEQLVVLHLNHSSDALTKIAVDDLVSNSMRALLAEDDTKASTLKDFLDGPARHFQYLESTYGWVPLNQDQNGINIEHSEGEDSHLKSIQFLNTNNDYFKDGEVFYIPFDKGLNVYTIEGPDGNPLPGLENVEKFYEGDLIIALPDESKNSNSEYKMADSDPKGIRFAHVSLYGGLVRQLIPGEIIRADDYATYLWKSTSATTNDVDFLNAVDENGDLINGIKEYIERLYQTKVDIDPKTHKIISSQLPDYLLGSLKYMGPASSLGQNVEEINTETYTGADLYKFLNSKKYSNFDSNEDSYDGSNSSGDVERGADSKDTEMRVGSYWIWQGDPIKVTGLTSIFDFDESEDDLWGDGEDDPESRENTTHTIEHVLNKGDWIVFNSNEKFDIIDHTANFVGLMVNGQILGGLVNVVDSDRTMTGRSWENGSKTFTVESVLETKVEPEAEDKLKISNPNGVLFKDKSGKAKVNATALPLISDTGLAFNSRFLVEGNQQGFKLGGRTDKSGQSTTFLFGKYSDIDKPTDDEWDSIPEAFKVKSFWDEDDDTVVAFNGDRYPTDISKNFEGFDFGNFLFEENKKAEDIYLFKFEWEKEPVTILPSHSGILATEEYVDYGFTVIKRIIDDLYLAFDKKTLTGNEDWLQTIVEYKDEDGTTRKKIYDSKVKQDYSKGESLILRLYTISKEDGTDIKPEAFTRFGTLSEIPSNLNDKRNSVVPSKEGYAVDYVLGNDSDAQTLNPSKPVGDVLNILPNHSGMLLNDNSVIDGGEW